MKGNLYLYMWSNSSIIYVLCNIQNWIACPKFGTLRVNNTQFVAAVDMLQISTFENLRNFKTNSTFAIFA